MSCLLLAAGCANNPAELRGKPLDEAISEYGNPAGAVDYQGARAFFFFGGEQENDKIQKNKDLLNPDMPITKTNFRSSGCFYTMNALWTSVHEDWTIQSVDASPNCKPGANSK